VYRLLGIARLFVVILIAVVGLLVMLLVALLPVRVKGVRLSAWICQCLARCFNAIFRVRCTCRNPHRLAQHTGFIFPNHISYLEPIVLFSVLPVRFLAAIEVKRRPIVGQLAEAVGTIFVERERRTSRAAARQSIVDALRVEPQPPLVIFPEGRLGPGDRLNPFRYGAFQIAVQNNIAYLPCAIRYDPVDIAVWHGPRGESLLGALWRFAQYPAEMHVEIIPLTPIQPTSQDDAVQLARVAEYAVARELGFILDV